MKNLHTVTMPDGTTATRKSAAHITYSHCLIGRAAITGKWVPICYSRDANKLARELNYWPGNSEKQIVPVNVEQSR